MASILPATTALIITVSRKKNIERVKTQKKDFQINSFLQDTDNLRKLAKKL